MPAEPPAPIRVCASSMNRMIGVGELCTSSITERRRCSNSPFIDAPACIRPISSAQSLTSRSGGGTSPAAMRWANPSTTAVLPTPASPVRIGIVLPPAHQHVDELADLVVAAEDRVHLAGFGLGGQVLREAVERRRAFRAGELCAPGVPAARSPEPSIGRMFSSSEPAQTARCSLPSASTLIFVEFLRNVCSARGGCRSTSARRQAGGRCGSGSRRKTAWRSASRDRAHR